MSEPVNPPADNPVLSPSENALLHQSGIDPGTYGALVAQAQINPGQMMAMGQVQTPEGVVDCLIVPLVMFVPLNQLNPRKGLLDMNGHPPNPVEGMMPIVTARAILPLDRLKLRPKLFIPGANGDFPEDR
jgi:hypothetical protein